MSDDTDFAETMRTRLQADLRGAMKRRETVEISTLRCLIAAIDNAGAVDPATDASEGVARWAGGSPYVATGSGPSEVVRRVLTAEDVAEILRNEHGSRKTAAATLDVHGRSAEHERAEMAVIARYLDRL